MPRKALRRFGEPTASPLELPTQVQLRVIDDVVGLIERAVALAEGDPDARGIDKAKALASLCGVALRIIETRDLAKRIELLEQVFRERQRRGDAIRGV